MVIIGGAGLAGLSAAFYTLKNGIRNSKVLLCEASDRCGGWMQSLNEERYLFEAGPRTVRPQGPAGANTLRLIEQLELQSSIRPIKMGHPAARNRMIYVRGQLHNLPSSFMDIFSVKKPFTRSLIATLWNEYRTGPKKVDDDEAMHEFIERRFGKELAEYAVGALVCGVCAGDSRQLSVKFMFDKLFQLEQNYGSVVRGMLAGGLKNSAAKTDVKSALVDQSRMDRWTVYTLAGGIEILPKRLLDSFTKMGGTHCPEHHIEKVNFYNDNQRVRVMFKGGSSYSSDFFLSALPAYSLASALRDDHPALAADLSDIQFVNVAVINLFYDDKNLLKHDAFGFLVPPIERRPILGVIFDSCSVPNENGTVLTVMMGGKWFEEYFGSNPTEEYLFDIAKNQLKDILGIDKDPEKYIVNILQKCIPQYVVGHQKRVNKIRKYIADNKLPMSICGSSYDGVGVNDVILSAKNAVNSLLPQTEKTE